MVPNIKKKKIASMKILEFVSYRNRIKLTSNILHCMISSLLSMTKRVDPNFLIT